MIEKMGLLLVAFFIVASSLPAVIVAQNEGGGDCDVELIAPATTSTTYIVFDAITPTSIFRTVTVPANQHADIEIFARDCCIRDDIVVIFLGGCLLATVDSRNGEWGSHPGETHTLSVGPGTHAVEYRNVKSEATGQSGWYVSETASPGTGSFICGGGPLKYIEAASLGIPGCGGVSEDILLATLEDDIGNTIEIKCTDQYPYADEYRVYFTPPGGGQVLIGRCPFERGANRGQFFHTGDVAPQNGTPDIFVRTRWESRDRGEDDDGDGKVDTWIYTYDVITGLLERQNVEESTPVVVYFDLREPGLDDPSPAPPNVPYTESPMEMSDLPKCDINHDGLCNQNDLIIFESAFGASLGDPGYNPFADFDGDDTVTDTDRELLGFAGPVSVEDQTSVVFSGIFHNRRTGRSKVNVHVTNISDTPLSTPLILTIKGISDPFVEVANSDGSLDGDPFFDLTGAVPGSDLDPGESTDTITIVFDNSLLRRFSINAIVMQEMIF